MNGRKRNRDWRRRRRNREIDRDGRERENEIKERQGGREKDREETGGRGYRCGMDRETGLCEREDTGGGKRGYTGVWERERGDTVVGARERERMEIVQ